MATEALPQLKIILDFGSIFIPNLLTKGSFHVPNIIPNPSKININSNLETDIDGMFVAGESAGVQGILASATMGAICAEGVCK